MNYIIWAESNDPRYNLAVEAHLQTLVKEGDVILYLWQNEHTVVIGKNQNILKECRARLLEEEGGYVARRTTGGWCGLPGYGKCLLHISCVSRDV